MAHIHIGSHHASWSFQQGCDSSSQFPAVLVHEVVLPQVQTFAVLIGLQDIPVGLIQKCLKLVIKTLPLSVSTFPPFRTALRVHPSWVADEDKERSQS